MPWGPSSGAGPSLGPVPAVGGSRMPRFICCLGREIQVLVTLSAPLTTKEVFPRSYNIIWHPIPHPTSALSLSPSLLPFRRRYRAEPGLLGPLGALPKFLLGICAREARWAAGRPKSLWRSRLSPNWTFKNIIMYPKDRLPRSKTQVRKSEINRNPGVRKTDFCAGVCVREIRSSERARELHSARVTDARPAHACAPRRVAPFPPPGPPSPAPGALRIPCTPWGLSRFRKTARWTRRTLSVGYWGNGYTLIS